MQNFIETFNVGTGIIDLSKYGTRIVHMRPIELYYKTDGTIDDKPSFAIIFQHSVLPPTVGQVSLEMLSKAMLELGYKIEPVK